MVEGAIRYRSSGQPVIRLKKWIVLALKVAVSVALLAYLAANMDLAAAWQRMLAVAPLMLALAIVVMFVQFGICALRWSAVMQAIGAGLPLRDLARIFFIGSFFNQALPSAVGGDAVRIFMVHKLGLSLGRAFNGVMLERVAIVVSIPLLATFVLPWFLPNVDDRYVPWIWAAFAFLVAGSVVGIALLVLLKKLPKNFHHWRLVKGLVGLGDDARRLFLSGRRTVAVLMWSVVGNANVSFAVYLLGRGLGLDIGVIDALAISPFVMLATTVPISIGGWGVREGVMVFSFAMIGISEDGSFALSILLGLAILVTSLPGGIVWLFTRDRPAVADLLDDVH